MAKRAPKSKDSRSAAKQRAEVIKTALTTVFRELADTREKKERMGAATGLSHSSVEALVYKGRGSFSSWANAICFAFDLKEEEVLAGLKHLSREARKNRALRPSDEVWFELDKWLTEDDKYYWANIIKYAAELKRSRG